MRTLHGIELNDFTVAYLVCALWSSMDNDDNPLDLEHDLGDLSKEAVQSAKDDCDSFLSANAEIILTETPDEYDNEQAGHDFWLTRNGHGSGFWDRGIGEAGKKLTDSAHSFGECNLYLGDDNVVYMA